MAAWAGIRMLAAGMRPPPRCLPTPYLPSRCPSWCHSFQPASTLLPSNRPVSNCLHVPWRRYQSCPWRKWPRRILQPSRSRRGRWRRRNASRRGPQRSVTPLYLHSTCTPHLPLLPIQHGHRSTLPLRVPFMFVRMYMSYVMLCGAGEDSGHGPAVRGGTSGGTGGDGIADGRASRRPEWY